KVQADGLAWLRRDAGATLLVRGPAELALRSASIDLKLGRVFIDTPSGVTAVLATPSGPLYLSQVRASIDVRSDGSTEAYVLARRRAARPAQARESRRRAGGPGAARAHMGRLDGRARDHGSRRRAFALRRRDRRRAQGRRAGLPAVPARDSAARRARHRRAGL